MSCGGIDGRPLCLLYRPTTVTSIVLNFAKSMRMMINHWHYLPACKSHRLSWICYLLQITKSHWRIDTLYISNVGFWVDDSHTFVDLVADQSALEDTEIFFHCNGNWRIEGHCNDCFLVGMRSVNFEGQVRHWVSWRLERRYFMSDGNWCQRDMRSEN